VPRKRDFETEDRSGDFKKLKVEIGYQFQFQQTNFIHFDCGQCGEVVLKWRVHWWVFGCIIYRQCCKSFEGLNITKFESAKA
jgi:hypothetical protein